MDDQKFREDIAFLLDVIDGGPASHGDREVLDLMREVVARSPVPGRAIEYLAKKGDESDIERLENVREIRVVQTPLAHVNILYRVEHLRERLSANVYRGVTFAPSIANTGPQAIYVREILRKARVQKAALKDEIISRRKVVEEERDVKWMQIMSAYNSGEITLEELHAFREKWEQATTPFDEELDALGREMIPPELLAMVVSFDEDGNPVCSVDLAEYGLSMPVIEPKPHQHDLPSTQYAVTFPHETEASAPTVPHATDTATEPAPDTATETGVVDAERATVIAGEAEQPSPCRAWLHAVIGIGVVAAIIGGVVAWRRKGKAP